MAKMNVSIPDDLRQRMQPLDSAINWSGVAAEAFGRAIDNPSLGSAKSGVRQFRLTISMELPADHFEASELIAKLRTPWRTMLDQVNTAGIATEYLAEMIDDKGPSTSSWNGNGRARKPGRPAGSKNRQPHTAADATP